jgi:plasmid maintenance system antidote protein VapI
MTGDELRLAIMREQRASKRALRKAAVHDGQIARLLALVPETPDITVSQAAELIGISRGHAHAIIRATRQAPADSLGFRSSG